jgi:hypothetical protein
MSQMAAFDALSRYRNRKEPCPRCNRPIERLSEHLKPNGFYFCRYMSVAERQREANQRLFADATEPE